MNNSQDPFQGPYRNQNSLQYQFRSYTEQERRFSQNNLPPNSRQEDTNYPSLPNFSHQQHQSRVCVRTFSRGQENDSEQYHSLNDQRTQANQQRQRNYERTNYGPRRYNNPNRGRFRGRNNFAQSNPRRSTKDCGSDNESVSSNDSQRQMRQDPKRSWSFDPSAPNACSLSNQSGPMNYSMINTPSHFLGAGDKRISQLNEGLEIGSITETSARPTKEALTALRNYKEHYESIMRNLDPSDLILDCRQQVEELCKEGIAKNLKNIAEIKSRLTCAKSRDAFKLHMENLIKQQQEFEDYIAKVKGQLSSAFASDVQDVLESTDGIKKDVQNECILFKRSFPGYAYKSTILNKIKDNQVTIISADPTYILNILLPIFIKNEFKKHSLVCCETSEMLRKRLKRNVFHLIYNKSEMNEIDEKKLNESIQFLIVEEFLNLFLNDYTIDEKNVFAILNLSLKRSVELDIILANLRDMLQNHDQARLVLLTSNYDHTSKYESYFAEENEVAVISMPSLILPVKTIWKSCALLPTDDYIEEVVKTILAIHSLNDTGDIMAFFPSLSDAKSTSIALTKKFNTYEYKNFECVLLHENSTSTYCLDLATKKYSSKRTIFLATDCAEMLIVQSVCYVIDCGLKKESMFDVNKKLDVMTTTFISRDKCKLRKSFAGAFSGGVCFRLYNKDDFCKEMPSSEYPEMLTVNPFNSMIKVFQHRPSTATTVDFVESLPKVTKQNALKLLKKYNAIKDNSLTVLGKNIVKLPFPATYSKLILLGIEWGLAFEAVVLAAFFSVKGRAFEYSTDPEVQRVTDAVKLQLIQGDSDTLSYLFIYKAWLENNCSQEWCKKHCINSETLRSVQLKVTEMCHIIGESLKENISQEFSTGESNTSSLLEMLFECFKENLCVFTGHYKSGYRILSSHCIAFLHPSSIICQMENQPQFIIFDHMTSTSRDFLVNITSIPNDFVMQGLDDLTIEFDYSDMFEKSLVRKVIEPVGERMIKQVLLGKKGKKLKIIEDQIKKSLSTTSLVIEPVADKGRVDVYALGDQIDQAVELVNEILKSQFEEIINSEQIHVLELKRGQVKIPVEVKWLKGANVASVKAGSSDKSSVTIQNDLEDEENPSDQAPCVIQQSINLTWTRRRCNGKGFITFEKEDFMLARKKFAMKNVIMLGAEVFVQQSKFEDYQLYITGIPPETRNNDLEKDFSRLLPGVKFVKVELKYTEPFETTQNVLKELKENVEDICRKSTQLEDFNIVLPQPKPSASIMKAFINVSNEEDIIPAANQLSKCTIGGFKLLSKAVYRSIIRCRIEICEALTQRFYHTLTDLKAELMRTLQTDQFEFEIERVLEDMANIKMLSNNQDVLQTLQRVVNVLLEGEVLNKMFNIKLGKIFCHGGHMWLKTIEKNCNVHIVEDYSAKALRLYGDEDSCDSAKRRIRQFLEDTENESVKCFPLSDGTNRMLLKAVIVEYGANLENFVESCELQSATLDIKSCSLSVHGNRESIEKAEDALRQLASGLDSEDFTDVLSNEEMCPVCVCPALNLTFRLELCGHLYCSECLQGLVEQAKFPIQCCDKDCQNDIVLDDISKVLGDDPEQIKALLHKAMKAYIDLHQEEIFNCPAPDCSMFFFKKNLTDNKINCPLCQNDICRTCNAVFHQGMTCDMYRGSKSDPDYSFKVWQKTSKEIKICPRCNSGIERNGGCDHMTCGHCGSHFCWVCVKEFPDADSVYRHLPFCTMHPRW